MILSVLSSPALVSGLMVVRAKNPVHSVLFPIPVFRDTSGLLLLLGLDFSAMIFPVVHIGAIAVSFLFVVMMFHIQIAEIHEEVLRYLPVSGIIGLILWWEMFFILDNETIPLLPTQRNTTSLRYTVMNAGKVRSWTNLETLGNLLIPIQKQEGQHWSVHQTKTSVERNRDIGCWLIIKWTCKRGL
ncbi:hypothetical protein CMV_020408 [Castanea mollissima]|uniref:NADH-ubiquinone oxidoreductase chain 6 n=1 Tax=Castanea mollissima TaxID=60419 RepID=A0A8J4VDN6_9ROSI|nr:hypothetical protein CMV_020408 [Castanea mollissima]